MATAIIAVGSAVSSAAASAGTALASYFGGGTAAAGGATTLTKVLSVGSALASIGQGFAQSRELKKQAEHSRLQEQQIATEGAQRRASMAREYEELVGEQQAVVAASGLNPGVGNPATIREATTKTAERNLSVSRQNTDSRQRVQRSRTRSLLSQSRLARTSGFINAGSTLLSDIEVAG